MNMNIYITDKNQELLRKEVSMSGLINRLLEEYYAKPIQLSYASADTVPLKDAMKVLPQKRLNLCGHGAGVQFCKFARPGKPCSYKAAK